MNQTIMLATPRNLSSLQGKIVNIFDNKNRLISTGVLVKYPTDLNNTSPRLTSWFTITRSGNKSYVWPNNDNIELV